MCKEITFVERLQALTRTGFKVLSLSSSLPTPTYSSTRHPHIHPPNTHLFIRPTSTYSSTRYPHIHPPNIHLFTHRHPHIHPPNTHPFTHPFIHQTFTYSLIKHPPIHPPNTHPYIHLFIHPTPTYSSTQPPNFFFASLLSLIEIISYRKDSRDSSVRLFVFSSFFCFLIFPFSFFFRIAKSLRREPT